MSVCSTSGSGIQLGQEQQRSKVAQSCSPRCSPPNGFTTNVSLYFPPNTHKLFSVIFADFFSKITCLCLYNWIYVKSLSLRWIAVENEIHPFLLHLISFLFHISQPPPASPPTTFHHLHSAIITAPRTKTLLATRRLSNRLEHFRLLCR